jgi:hypothetical protein
MADDALMDTATKAVERMLGPLNEKLRHIEKELEPVRGIEAELKRIGQHLADRDTRLTKVEEECVKLRSEVDQTKWVSRVALGLLLAGAVAWFQKSSAPPPIYVNVAAPVSGSPAPGP